MNDTDPTYNSIKVSTDLETWIDLGRFDDEDEEIGVVIPVSVNISDMLEHPYPEDKVDIVSEKGIVLFRDAVAKDLFKEGGDN